MNPDRLWLPLWIALGMAATALLWSHATSPPDEPGPSTREYVRKQLDAANGTRMVLPIKLPAGYDYGIMYAHDTWQTNDDDAGDADTADPYETSDKSPADSRSVVFAPTSDHTKLPIVILCVQPIDSNHELCPATTDRRHLQLRHQQTRVAIYAASKDQYDVVTWRNVRLTTDLDKVTWLH